MKKSDLKDGMVVEFRNGKRYMFISEIDLFVSDDLGMYASNFDEYVVKVFKPVENCRFTDILSKSNELIWERKDVEKLNHDQHNKLKALLTLGYEWIARDKNGESCAYDSKPFKCNSMWNLYNGDLIILKILDIPFIKWEEDEPRSIKDLLKLEVK